LAESGHVTLFTDQQFNVQIFNVSVNTDVQMDLNFDEVVGVVCKNGGDGTN